VARIEDLIDEIPDPELRRQIGAEVKHLKSTKRFGLVYEEHVPETVSLFGLPVRPGSIVQKRTDPDDPARWQVVSVDGDTAAIAPVGAQEPAAAVPARDLLTVKRFEEPIYPGLTPVGEVRRGPANKPCHSVISGENFHALQLLAYTHAGKVDVIYIDPPYNTGDKSWKYNNRFVDGNDAYRHSKWLAMMEKRLKLAKALLKPDGVLIVTIDEHEVHRLGLLLSEVFRECRIQMVSSVVNPKGVVRDNEFSRTNEYVLFLTVGDVVLYPEGESGLDGQRVPWQGLRRTDITSARGTTKGGKSQFYPIYVNDSSGRIEEIGQPLPPEIDRSTVPGRLGCTAVLPIRPDGTEMNWGLAPGSLRRLIQRGYVKATTFDADKAQPYAIRYLTRGRIRDIEEGRAQVVGFELTGAVIATYREGLSKQKNPTTAWARPSHNAQLHGTGLLSAFLPDRQFPYPKSLYAVGDALRFFAAGRTEATVLDFFAGSGTTLHSVAMLNAQDGGRRQCILVTNNDVSDAEAKALNTKGHYPGDPPYEAQGIFEAVTKPRVAAAITGIRPDGKPVEGAYLEQYLADHAYADGFDENVAFFRMDYVEPDLVELGRQYAAIAPLLWMAAGSVGSWEPWDGTSSWSAPRDASYAVLFDESAAAAFGAYVESRSEEITHVWIVTDSHSAFLDLQEELPEHVVAGQLYRDYLRNFVVNAPGAVR
jgi:adenine-specific DNA-methyltransferase